jgi:uncharacterized protein (TIGR03067 family)
MRWQAVLVVAAAVGAAVGAEAGEKAAATDKAKLQGSWALLAAEAMGKPAPKEFIEQGLTLVFSGDKAEMTGGKKQEEVTFKLDETKKPRQIDFIPKDKNMPTAVGIYELKGDTLKLCFGMAGPKAGADAQPKRPTAFDSEQGILFTLKRRAAKKGAQ